MSGNECVSRDTVRFVRRTRSLVWLSCAYFGFAAAARAEPLPLPASVVWTRDDVIYVAAPDSGVLSPGMMLSLARGRHELASASITQLLDPWLAVARVRAGSLAREKRLDRLRVLGEPPRVEHLASLRVGLPGRGRANLLFACVAPGVARRLGSTSYTLDSLAAGTYRMIRATSTGDAGAEPDTVLVRLFADAADQEIALERDELDVAVFWPGELSARLRGDARWHDAPRGLRARGVLACVATGGDSAAAPTAGLAAVNRDLFGGDLLPWSELEPAPLGAVATARVIVDPALPGARMLERVLGRWAMGGASGTVRLTYLDVPLAAHDSVGATWRTPGVTPVFALRCPVLAIPAAQASVARLGADAFANLMLCAGGAP